MKEWIKKKAFRWAIARTLTGIKGPALLQCAYAVELKKIPGESDKSLKRRIIDEVMRREYKNQPRERKSND